MSPRVGLPLALLLAACSGRGSSPPGISTTTSPGSGGAGGAPTTSSATGGAPGTGGGESGGASSDAGDLDGGDLDAASLPDGLGKGGLPLGAMCGDYAHPDGGPDAGTTCGAGLACCYPCKMQMCDTVCVIACSPQQTGCLGGCIPQI